MDEALYSEMARIQFDHWWYRARRRIIAGEIGRMDLAADAVLLEAGCGPGGNLPMLSRFGQVFASEPHEGARTMADELGIATVLDGALPDGLPFDRAFDLICAFDVIEHIADDGAALRALHGITRPGGRLLLTVPAYQWMWSDHDVRNHHHRRYTRGQLRRAVSGAGFHVERATYFNTHLFVLIAGIRLLQKLTGDRTANADTVPASWLNRTLEAIFAAEAIPLRWLDYPFGVSILLTARRA